MPADIRKEIQADKGDIFDFQVIGDKVIMTLQKLVPMTGKSTKKDDGIDISKYIGIAKGTYGSAAEIDEYIRNERASWD